MSDFASMLRDGANVYPRIPRKSTVAVTPTGNINVFIASAYQTLGLGQAINLRDQLARAIDEVMNREVHHDSAA